MANELNQDVLQRLARLGAQARLEQIEMERKAILAAFPELFGKRRGRRPAAMKGAALEAPAAKAARRRPKMSAARRKEVSERMKKYWAERRKAKG